MQRSRQLIYIITPAEFIRHIAKDLIEHAENNEGIASWIITHGGTAIKQPDVWKFWFDLISKPENPIWYIPFRQQPICLWAIWRNKGSIHDSSRPAKIADFLFLLSDLEQFSTNAFLDFLAGRMVIGILRQMELATLPHTQPPKTRLSKKAPQCTSASNKSPETPNTRRNSSGPMPMAKRTATSRTTPFRSALS
jgi:hypothetical protein